MKLRRILFLGGALLLVLVKFTIDIIGKNVELQVGGLGILRECAILGAFVLLYFAVAPTLFPREQSPIRKLGLLLVSSGAVIVLVLLISALSVQGFDAKNLALLPLDYPTLFAASLTSLILGAFALLVIRLLRDLVLYNRRRGTLRNFIVFLALVFLTAGSTFTRKPLDSGIVTSILFGLSIWYAIVNSFRLPWIVFLTKREKIFSLIYGFFLFLGFTALNVIIGQNSFAGRSLLYYSVPLREIVLLLTLWGNIYFGMTFISTLFHLPTAEAFERKRSEVTSLHNLSRLITQVFDFNELVETVTSMTLQVCEAQSCWLEIIHTPQEASSDGVRAPDGGGIVFPRRGYFVDVAGMKNVTQAEIDELLSAGDGELRDTVFHQRTPIVIDDLARDARFAHGKKGKPAAGSLVIVPLISHTGVIGILYATKATPFGFVKDDVEMISAFADQATTAIENSRLIKKSIERERLIREMTVAQEIQRKLLPQALPEGSTFEIDAVSTPAFEVGGDYYDFVRLGERRIGIAVGDVSGKGVSAAFYMSEMKGIFQALSRMYDSPREFMVKANDALAGSIDKHAFVSLIYAVVDLSTGELRVSRAGHCPMVLVSGERVEYIRPNGMGMGLAGGGLFSGAIEEQGLRLRRGDVCIFYTDGVTESRRGEEEFGYERLLEAARRTRERSAAGIKEAILEDIGAFTDRAPNDDDLTLVVLKWHGASEPS